MSKTVLSIDDSKAIRDMVSFTLSSAGYRVIEAENGDEAVKLWYEIQPDLVLMDVSMPLKDGLQATREIRTVEGAQGRTHCPVVALTANAFGEDRAACLAAGMDGFLVKPLGRAELLSAIALFTQGSPLRDAG